MPFDMNRESNSRFMWNSYNSPSTDKVFIWGPPFTKCMSSKNGLFGLKSVIVDLNFYSFRDRALEKHKPND